MPRPGFFHGMGMLPAAVRRVWRAPAYWPYVALPPAVMCLLGALGIFSVARYAGPALDAALAGVTSITWLNQALLWASVLGASVLALFIALLLTTPICSPALERLVALTEAELGAPPRAPLGFAREVWCGVRAQAAPLIWTGPAWVVLFAIDLAAPVFSPLTAGVRVLLLAVGVAWTLLDYPLTLRGVPVRERLRLLRRAPLPVLGFGVAFALLFWLPCCAVVFIGVGVIGATELLLALAPHDPQLQAVLQPRSSSLGARVAE